MSLPVVYNLRYTISISIRLFAQHEQNDGNQDKHNDSDYSHSQKPCEACVR